MNKKEKKREYWVIDVTNLNNNWRLPQEIKDSNCQIVAKYSEERK